MKKAFPNHWFKFCILISVSVIAFVWSGYGFFYERYKMFLESLFSGSIVNEPLSNFLNLAYIGLDKLYPLLYGYKQDFSWFDYSAVAYSLLSVFLVITAVSMLARKRFSGFTHGILVVVLFAILMTWHIVSCNNSKDAFIPSSIMLMTFWGWNHHKKLFGYLVAMAIFMLAVLIRFEFAALGVLLFGCFILPQWQHFLKQWKWFVAPALFFLLVGGGLYYDRNYSADFAKETDFSQYLIADAQHVVLFESFEDPKDSLRYLAAKELWLSDTANLSIDFFRSLQQYKVGFSVNYFRNYLPYYARAAWEMLYFFMQQNLPFLLLPLLLLAYFLAEAKWVNGNFRWRAPVLLIPFALIIMLLYVLCYLVRMETTVLQPALVLSALFMLATGNPPATEANVANATRLRMLLTLFLFANCIYAAVHLHRFATVRKQALAANVATCVEADSLAAGKYLVLDVYSNQILDHSPGNNFVFKKPKNVLLYDCGQLILVEPFLSYHANICRCNPLNNVEYYNFLLQNKEQVLLLSDPTRMKFVTGYLRGMHNMKIGYSEVQGNFAAHRLTNFGSNLNYYVLTDSL